MNDIHDMQLMPGTKKRLGFKVRGENNFLYIGSAILGAALITSFSLARYETYLNSQVEDLDNQILVLEEQRDKAAEDGIIVVKDQLELTSQLLAAHIAWPKAFAKIESLLQGQVQFESMSGNVLESTLDISGFAPNYSIIAKQIASFLSDIGISDVMISKTNSLPNGKIQFDMRLKFNKSDFVQ